MSFCPNAISRVEPAHMQESANLAPSLVGSWLMKALKSALTTNCKVLTGTTSPRGARPARPAVHHRRPVNI